MLMNILKKKYVLQSFIRIYLAKLICFLNVIHPFVCFKNRLSGEDLSNTHVPYLRRLSDLKHIKLVVSEVVSRNGDFWTVLSNYWCTVVNAEDDSYLQLHSGPQFSISEDGFSITRELHDERVSLTLLDLPDSNRSILIHRYGNISLVSKATLQVYFKPNSLELY
eukprot:snap_masked-scaffold_28-processed-gene-4.70-mRNA-1 protein AED:1.00 eAED:1.00 QI:0/0/0/0/1/1/2/0/164